MNTRIPFYLCPTCFAATDTHPERHRHPMVWCDAGEPGSERRKPLTDERGKLQTAAPRWFVEALGWLPPNRYRAGNGD
jgi:hypothetical protein